MDRHVGKKIMGKPNIDSSGLSGRRFCLAPAVILMLLFSVLLNTATATHADKIVYRLKWLKNVSVVGGLYAQDNGFFRDAGLSVTIKAGGPERDAIKELELGYAQFGVASADQVIRALSKGAPVVVLAQIFQTNPLQWIYHADNPDIADIQVLKGKTIGITFGGNDEVIMRTLLASVGLSENDVRLFSVRYDYTPFYRQRVALWPVYKNSQAIIIQEKLKQGGKRLRFLNPAAFGVRFAANSIVTSRHMTKKHPEIVHRFVTSLMAGWQAALNPENQDKALESLRGYDRDTRRDILEKQLAATRALALPGPGIPMGTVDAAAWRQTEKILLEQKQIPAPVHVQNAFFPRAVVNY